MNKSIKTKSALSDEQLSVLAEMAEDWEGYYMWARDSKLAALRELEPLGLVVSLAHSAGSYRLTDEGRKVFL